jgi:hypothetical protein
MDQNRRGAVVFMAQAMYGGPARSPFQKRLFAAIEADRAQAWAFAATSSDRSSCSSRKESRSTESVQSARCRGSE